MKKKFIQNLLWLRRYRLEQVVNNIICNIGQNLFEMSKLLTILT